MYNDIYKGKKILVTGCNGFKGSWLCSWLKRLGAEVIGWGHEPPTDPNHASLLGDVYETQELAYWPRVPFMCNVDLVFHLAAHAIVADCFIDPRETIENNVMAAANILEAVRKTGCKGVVLITTDKVYQDENWIWGYKETDKLGGYDPYTTSKLCIEQIIEMYRNSYGMNIATARAGNVIGGGDWGSKRLIPDIMRSAGHGETAIIHSPNATRPWQHVLAALDGYLLLGEKILNGGDVNGAWNFGPMGEMSVATVLKIAKQGWSAISWEVIEKETHPFMVNLLKIDSTKARKELDWNPPWDMEETIVKTTQWYKKYYQDGIILTEPHIWAYEARLNG